MSFYLSKAVCVRTVHFDLVCGASGDMILAALLDLGAPLERLRSDLARMGIDGLSVDSETVRRSGLRCRHMKLSWSTPREYRHLPDILEIIAKAKLPERAQRRCETVLQRLAEAEADAHGIPVDKVHFHEIGAVDTIVDIAGAALCLEYLDAEEVTFSTLTVGRGSIKTAHGRMPVPVPATARMIRGLEVRTIEVDTEVLTPTGCALLTALGRQQQGIPDGIVSASGNGCGDREFEHHPNLLRAFLVNKAPAQSGSPEYVCVIESDMDHVSGEVMAFAAQECMDAGALDVSWCPQLMKKGRPGYRLTVIGEPAAREALTDIIIGQTRSLGVRYHFMQRTVAERSAVEAQLDGAAIDAKQCRYKEHTFTKPEFDALAALARRTNRPLPELFEMFLAQSRR
ncbi:MAG: nickel pincer cofactor biosynthesis protein LarC [Chitinivibrionales bacterium]|nr:nickel pincer cofactor biosynthesis protein LarC [Chitinivibrionales bacterium]